MSQCFVPRSTSLHITGPTQSPRVDKPHPATIACTRPAVAGSAWKNIAQVVGNCSGITDGDNRKFPEDILNGYDVKNWLSVVKLARTGFGSQRISTILRYTITSNKCKHHNTYNRYSTEFQQNNFINSYNTYNFNNYHSQDRRMSPVSTQGRNRRLWIQCLL